MLRLPVEEVVARIGRTHKNLSLDLSDVAEWCYEALEEQGAYDHLKEERNVKLPVENGMARLPSNIYRLLRVASGCEPVEPLRNGRCLMAPLGSKEVVADLLVFDTDERGYPLVDDVFMPVCAWYVVKKTLYEPFLKGEINEKAYRDVEQNYLKEALRARGSFRNVTDAKLDRIMRLIRSSIIVPRYRRS